MKPEIGGPSLSEEFEFQADWRRQKAEEYPNDARNLEAAAIFDRLAGSTNAIDAATAGRFQELRCDESTGFEAAELFSQMTREIGFQSWPETAD